MMSTSLDSGSNHSTSSYCSTSSCSVSSIDDHGLRNSLNRREQSFPMDLLSTELTNDSRHRYTYDLTSLSGIPSAGGKAPVLLSPTKATAVVSWDNNSCHSHATSSSLASLLEDEDENNADDDLVSFASLGDDDDDFQGTYHSYHNRKKKDTEEEQGEEVARLTPTSVSSNYSTTQREERPSKIQVPNFQVHVPRKHQDGNEDEDSYDDLEAILQAQLSNKKADTKSSSVLSLSIPRIDDTNETPPLQEPKQETSRKVQFSSKRRVFFRHKRFRNVPIEDLWYSVDEGAAAREQFLTDAGKVAKLVRQKTSRDRKHRSSSSRSHFYQAIWKTFQYCCEQGEDECSSTFEHDPHHHALDKDLMHDLTLFFGERNRVGLERMAHQQVFRDKYERRRILRETILDLQEIHYDTDTSGSCHRQATNCQQSFEERLRRASLRITLPSVLFAHFTAQAEHQALVKYSASVAASDTTLKAPLSPEGRAAKDDDMARTICQLLDSEETPRRSRLQRPKMKKRMDPTKDSCPVIYPLPSKS